MPSIKRAGIKAQEVKTGFEPYDGVEPSQRGMYRARIKQAEYKKFRPNADTGIQNEGYKLLVELEAQSDDPKKHAKFDGFPAWTNLVLGDKESMIAREQNFYAALGCKDEPTIVTEAGDMDSGVKIKTIGGKNPINAVVNIDLKPRRDGQAGMEVDGIYKFRELESDGDEPDEDEEADEDDDLMEEVEEDDELEDEDGEGPSEEERTAELKAASVADLKALAAEYEIDLKGKKKADLIAAIVELEFSEAEEELDDEEEELDEELDDELEDEEEELEEEEDDERAERAAELADLDRLALRKILVKVNKEFQVFKKTTDEELIEAILDAEFGAEDETPF